MTRRKNVKRIDPRYFLAETVNRKERGDLKEIDYTRPDAPDPDIEPDPDVTPGDLLDNIADAEIDYTWADAPDPDEPDPDAPVVGRTDQSTPYFSADAKAEHFWSSDPDDPRTGFPEPDVRMRLRSQTPEEDPDASSPWLPGRDPRYRLRRMVKEKILRMLEETRG